MISKISYFLFLLLLFWVKTDTIKLNPNKFVPIMPTSGSDSKRYFISSDFYFGVFGSKNENGNKIPCLIDFSSNLIYVPSADQTSYGLNCDKSIQCEKYGKDQSCLAFRSVAPTNCQKAKTTLRFDSSTEMSNEKAPTLDFNLVDSVGSWENNFGKVGLLGLGRTSQFWTFFMKAFEKQKGNNYLDLSFHVGISSSQQLEMDPDLSDSALAINGRYSTYPLSFFSQKKEWTAWAVSEGSVKLNNEIDQIEGDICLDSASNNYIVLPQPLYDQVKSAFFKKLCGETSCSKEKTKLSQLEDIEIKIKSISIKISAKDLVVFKEDKAEILINVLDKTSPCFGQNFKMALGLFAFRFIEMTIRTHEDLTQEVGVAQIKVADFWFFFWMLVFLVCDLSLMTLIVYLFRRYCPVKPKSPIQAEGAGLGNSSTGSNNALLHAE